MKEQTKTAHWIKPSTDDATTRRIEKLTQQVKRFDEKGYTNTPHHQELARLLNSPVRDAYRGTEEIKEYGN